MDARPKRGRGRPTVGERVPLGLRVTPEMKRRLDAAAKESGRSQSQEAEIRLERSFDRDDYQSGLKEVKAQLVEVANKLNETAQLFEDAPKFDSKTIEEMKHFPHLYKTVLQWGLIRESETGQVVDWSAIKSGQFEGVQTDKPPANPQQGAAPAATVPNLTVVPGTLAGKKIKRYAVRRKVQK